MTKFANTTARDRAWVRWFARNGARPMIDRSALGKPPNPPLTAAERLEDWRRKYSLLTVEQTLAPVARRTSAITMQQR